jgi:hypothetical protein
MAQLSMFPMTNALISWSGSAAHSSGPIVQSALEVVNTDPATRARLLALLAEDLVSGVAGTTSPTSTSTPHSRSPTPAEGICAADGLPGMLAAIGDLRA